MRPAIYLRSWLISSRNDSILSRLLPSTYSSNRYAALPLALCYSVARNIREKRRNHCGILVLGSEQSKICINIQAVQQAMQGLLDLFCP